MMTTEPTKRISSGTDYILPGGLVAIAFLTKLYFLQFFTVISADGIGYIGIAKDFINGKGLAGAGHFPSFYPILVGLTSLMAKDLELAGRFVSMFMGSLIVVPIYLLAREFFDRRVGLIAAILTITWPSIRSWSNEVMSQATYMTLVLFGIYLIWRACKRESWLSSLAGGACLGCAYLTRSEGILVFFALTAVLITVSLINRLPARKLVYLLMGGGAFLVVCSPYFYLLHELTGTWQLTGKSSVTLADALSEYLGIPDLKHYQAFKNMGYMDVIRGYPEFIRQNVLKNLKNCWNQMLPVYGWGLAVLGFAVGGWGREKLVERAYLLATFAPLGLIIVFFFIGPEYTQPYLPILFLWIGQGLLWLEELVPRRIGKDNGERDKRFSRSGVFSLLIVLFFSGVTVIKQVPADRNEPYSYEKDGGRFDDKQIGIRLRGSLPENAVIMTRSGRIGFYSQRRYVTPPQAGYAKIVDYARKNKVDYLIATVPLLNMRPQLEFLYMPLLQPQNKFAPPPELDLVYVGQEPGGLPYLVYRFR